MISETYAATQAPDSIQNLTSFATIGLMMLVFYIMMIRPQRKRQQDHQKVVDNAKVGDEIATMSGIIGKITNISAQYVTISTSQTTELMLQRQAITTILPNGTLKTL